MNYNEDPKTIDLYPAQAFLEDLTPDDIAEGIEEKSTAIYEATKGWGNDKKALIELLGKTTAEERMQVHVKFSQLYEGDSLKDLMKKECGGSDFGQALQYLALDPVSAECKMIKKACAGIGTNETLLYSVLCGRSNKDMEILKKTYYKNYTKDLVSVAAAEVGGTLEKVLVSSLQAAEEEYDPGFHTEEKAIEDAKTIYEAGQGRFGKDTSKLAKIIVLSPPKHLKNVSFQYADKYGYTLFKAVEKEFGGDSEKAALFTLGIKLKPFQTIAKLIKEACAGFGTNELLLTCTLLRYQKYLKFVNDAHLELFEKSIHDRVRDECKGNYEDLLLAIINTACPEE
jgi:hypothetical protein